MMKFQIDHDILLFKPIHHISSMYFRRNLSRNGKGNASNYMSVKCNDNDRTCGCTLYSVNVIFGHFWNLLEIVIDFVFMTNAQ